MHWNSILNKRELQSVATLFVLILDLVPFRLPEGITLRPMTDADVQIANDAWPYRDQYSLHRLQTLATVNPNVGAFNCDGQLVAWVFR